MKANHSCIVIQSLTELNYVAKWPLLGGELNIGQNYKIKRFTYFLRQQPSGGSYVQFDIRLQNQRAKIGLTPAETMELWITCAEMPTDVADLVDERTWEGHRKIILAMLADHYLTPFH